VLGHNPGFTAVAVLSLALGIGANTAIFSLVNALLLRELPVRQPERLVQLSALRRDDKIPFSYPMFREVERGQRVFSDLIGWSYGDMSNVEVNGVYSQAAVDSVTGNYYSELEVVPLLGRLIAPDDLDAGSGAASPVAVLGYEFWQRRFGGASDAVGKQIRIEGQAFTIIGVTRTWFTGMTTGRPPEVTVPMKTSDNRSRLWVFVTARLKDGVTVAQARAQLESFWPAVLLATASTETPGLRRQTFLSMGLDVAPVATGVARDLRSQFTRPLYVLLGIVGLILVVACVNLANLMLARAAAHSYEVSVRMALGASRWALGRQVFTESLVLSVSGALLGLAFGYWGSRLLVTLVTQGYLTPVTLDVRPDWRVLLLTAVIAILTGILFGVAPAWRGSREDPASVLRRNARSSGGDIGKAGKVLLVTQVALSLVLLVGAGLLVRSFQKLCTVDTGFEERVLQVSLYPRPGGQQTSDVNSYRRQLIDRISGVPGVLSVGFSNFQGPGQRGWQEAVSTMAGPLNPNAGVMTTSLMVSPGFLRTLGIRLALGRDFDWRDDERRPRVAIISSSLAARLLPSRNAIGQRIRFGFMPEFHDLEVVGIASTARLFDLRDAAAPVIYLPCLQHSEWAERGDLFLRTHKAPDAIARTVGHEIELFGHEYPLSAKTVGQAVSQALATDRVVALLSAFFAVLALLLASVGLYGLTSYGVVRRTREIGIRTALGARPAAVRWGVLRDALTLAVAGIALGVPLALGASRLIASMLFGISSGDVPTVAFVSLLLLLVALLASYLPARRASRIDPTVALRSE
jgi:predicted permease